MGVKTPRTPESRYKKKLIILTRKLRNGVKVDIIPLLRQFKSEYINDGYAQSLSDAFDNLRQAYVGINVNAKIVANSFVENANNANKQRFYSAMNTAVGVDLRSVIQNEGLEDILVATTRENVALIKSIPEEYFKKIETIVFTGTTQGNAPGSMIKEIMKINKTTEKRARLIARDQSSKLNSALSQQRQQNLGIEEYKWRTSGDERVRDEHKANNGKIFKWNNPPKATGHPGTDINCRCIAEPIIKI